MKDYIRINRAFDQKSIQVTKNNVAIMQEAGLYPKEFTYPLTLQFELTGQCNLACKHCYNRSGDKDRITLMTPEKWCELAHEIVEDGGVFQCIISGGEPLLLGDKLFDIMDILHEDGTSFVVITNGYLLNSEKVRRFLKYRFFWFQISIDGINAEMHDEFRGVKGSWERAVNGALEISNCGIPLTIAHSVTKNSLKHLEDMVNLAYELGAGNVILGEILPSGRALTNSEVILSYEQRNFLYKQIQELASKYKGKIEVQRAADLKTQMARYACETNAGGIIRPNGDFRLDCMAPFIIGNVLEKPLKEIWDEKGKYAWKTSAVQQFISSIDENTQMGNVKNHIGRDIHL